MRYILHRAMLACAATLVALLTVLIAPAQAGYWQPVDKNGNPINPFGDPARWYGVTTVTTASSAQTYPAAFATQGGYDPLQLPRNENDPWLEMYWYGGSMGVDYLESGASNWYYGGGYNFHYWDSHGYPTDVQGSATVDGQMEHTLYLKWIGSETAPDNVRVLVRTVNSIDFGCSAQDADATATVNDGLGATLTKHRGDPQGVTANEYFHFVTAVNRGDGTATFTIHATTHQFASVSWSPPAIDLGGYFEETGTDQDTRAGGSQVRASAMFHQDNRQVRISSDVDPTYHRGGPNDRVANVRAPDSDTIDGDTVKPPPHTISGLYNFVYITYSPNTGGIAAGWGLGSRWNLFNSLMEGDVQDFVGNERNLVVEYPDTSLIPGNIITDHVHLSVTDPTDGVNVTDNYHMRFHDKYDDWTEDAARREERPRSYQEDPADYIVLKDIDNHGPVSQTEHVTEGTEVSRTEDGSVEGEIGVPEIAALKLKADIKVSDVKKRTFSSTEDFVCPAHTHLRWHYAMNYAHRYGSTGRYNQSGYDLDVDWNGTSVYQTTSEFIEEIDQT